MSTKSGYLRDTVPDCSFQIAFYLRRLQNGFIKSSIPFSLITKYSTKYIAEVFQQSWVLAMELLVNEIFFSCIH